MVLRYSRPLDEGFFYLKEVVVAKLVYPDISHMMLMNKYLQETFDYGELFINGDGGCHTYQDYTQWLKKKTKII